ncbi:hypothetical protein [Nocardia carnea]|uniref:hypothetical protein n=1 Tax=Nocardia carnea TaxID=37328 RepID=UPI0024551EAD|nr:hypothetical protein [Nocardia carnea]
MTSVSVDLASLTGFKLDLQDLKSVHSLNSARLLAAVTLPSESAGLIATLVPGFGKLNSELTTAQQTCSIVLDGFGNALSTTAAQYQSTDSATAVALVAASDGGRGDEKAAVAGPGVARFGGLQLPSLPDVPENQYTLRQAVTSALDLISIYDDRFNEAIGVKPAADFLMPLVGDWEALQAIGRRIGLVGINDFVASQNLAGGTRWLQSGWSGDAAQAFGVSTGGLGDTLNGRSLDLEAVSKIVENGGMYLERSVYNQAAELCSEILRPMTFLGSTFPLGGWAPYVNRPIRESVKTEIAAALEAMQTSARSRQDSIQSMIDRMNRSLDYSPGRPIPAFHSQDFDIPEKVVVDVGVRKYGYGDNLWWEDRVDSVV